MKQCLLFSTFLLLFASLVHATTIIDTTPADGSAGLFGEPNSATYGQVFTVPAVDNRLDNYTFYIDDDVNPDFVDFEAFVMGWDGSKATGSILYQSSAISTTNNGGSNGFEAFTINTGGLTLNSGQQYVAFFSASNLFDGSIGTSSWSINSSNVYSGGDFVYMNNGNNFSQLTSSNWRIGSGWDLAFKMTFNEGQQNPIPEPATMILFGVGLMGLAGVSRRKK